MVPERVLGILVEFIFPSSPSMPKEKEETSCNGTNNSHTNNHSGSDSPFRRTTG